MKEGFNLVIVAMVLLIILLSVLTVFSLNFNKLRESTTETDDHSGVGLSDEWCRIRHGGEYFLVDLTSGVMGCDQTDCAPATKVLDGKCDPSATPSLLVANPTCCCMCN
ncbi:MAG: hypothetical protein KAQ92_05260 [Candidatus Aenigmarchaeota archaeon]|nr:hypothetical protein [Candidatus Aenigmarchaeota archaeon]